MGKVLQTLTVNLEANTATFSDAMSKASQISLSSAKSIQKSFMLVSGAAIAAGTAVAGALAGIVVKATEYASSIELMAQKTGISTQELSKLSYASTLTGGNLDDLSGMLVKFNKNAADTGDGTGKAKSAFAGLGVAVTDASGHFRPAGDVLQDTIAKLSAMPDSLKKSQAEVEIFGRAGAALAPILKVLGANAAQTAADMKTFGLSMSSDTAEGAERLSQTYERTKLAFTGFGLTIFTTALPALQALADKVISLASDGSLQKWATTLGNVVTTAAKAASDSIQFLSDHGTTLKHTIEALIALEVASWLLSINTKALSAAGGMDVLVSSVGKAMLKMTGLSGLATALSAATATAYGTVTALGSLAASEGIVATATYAMQTAWASFSAAVVANPITIALGLIAAALYVVYKALTDDVAASAKFGDAAVSWHDYWHAAIDNTTASLHAMKEVLLGMSIADIQKGIADYKAIPTFGVRVHQEANTRVANTPAPTPTPKPTPPSPQPMPNGAAAKPDPYKAEIAKLNQELTNSQLALNAAMQSSVDAQRAATEAGKAGLIITELQTKLKRNLSATEKSAISSLVVSAGENTHNAQVVESLRQRTDAAHDALLSAQALAGAVGQGQAAEDEAKRSTDAAVMARELGTSASVKYADAIKALAKAQADAAKSNRDLATVKETSDLRQSAADTNSLADATLRGASAVERETLALRLQAIVRAHKGDDIALTNQLVDATTAQYNAEKRLQAIQTGQQYTSPLAQYSKALQGIAKASDDAKSAGVDIDLTQVWLANRDAALHYQEQIEKLHAVYGSAKDGAHDFFTDMANQSQTAATIVHDTLTQAFDGLNENLTKALTGQKTAWAELSRSIGQSLVKAGLHSVETSIAATITGKDKADPAAKLDITNSKLDIINASILSMGGKGLGSIADSTSDSLTSDAGSSGTGGFLSGLLGKITSFIPGLGSIGSLFGSLFGGHRALGGSVSAGMSYDVGEQGRETFVPKSDGTIIPNSKLGKGGFTYHIHTDGGMTPEQTDMRVRQALNEAHPGIVQSSVQAMSEAMSRRPRSSR